jgi:hypothetical protein
VRLEGLGQLKISDDHIESRKQKLMFAFVECNIDICYSRAMALGSTHILTEMSTRNLPDLTAIVSRLSRKMWEPRRLTTIWASTARYRDSFTFIDTADRSRKFWNITV